MWPFRRKGEDPPSWASFFTAEEYDTFVELVATYFAERGISVKIEGGVVKSTTAPEFASGLGLQNLAQTCHLCVRADWPGTIAQHFDTVRQATESHQRVTQKRFEEIESSLAVRLWPEEYLESVSPDKLIYRRDLEGTITAVVLDLPSSVETVTRDEADHWHKDDEELFRLGVANLRSSPLPTVEEHDLSGLKLMGYLGQSFFVASHALTLHEHPECLGTCGTLVAIPHRHALLCCPIADRSVISGMTQFVAIVQGMYTEGPGSITSNIYWYHMGRLLNLPYEIKGQELKLTPPDEFVQMLNTLTPVA